MKEQFLKIGGHRICVREQGEGAPLLLIHGLGAHLRMWGPVEARLRSRRLITLDLPGTGESSIPLRPLHVREIATLIDRVLDTLGYEAVDVMGYSFGGAVAQMLAYRYPHRVRRLALVSAIVGIGSVPGAAVALLTTSMPIRYWWPWLYEKSYVWTVGGPEPDPHAFREQIAMRQAAPPSLAGYAWQYLAAVSWSSLGWMERIPHQTLVVSGTDDRLVPHANSLNIAAHIPNARLFLAENEGHMLLFDAKSAALPVLSSFFGIEANALDAQRWDNLEKPTREDYRHAVRARFGKGALAALSARTMLGFQRCVRLPGVVTRRSR